MIDDDAGFLEITAAILKKAGYEVLCAETGAEGIQNYSGFRPDLVITDVFMPDMDGLETLTAIRKIDPLAKVLAVSGSRAFSSSSLRPAKYLGADAVLTKPFTGEELLNKIDALSNGTIQHGEVTTFWRQKAKEHSQH